MTKALKTYIPILALLLAVSLASCDSAETRQRIAAADSLAEASPRAAIALADSLAPGVASRSSRMRLALIKAKAQNKLGMRLPKDTLAMLADYYDSHGSVNERMLADYIQGWACLDNDDTPKACIISTARRRMPTQRPTIATIRPCTRCMCGQRSC